MKPKKLLICLICMFSVCIFAGCLTACGGEEGQAGVRVIFSLEGGSFRNSGRDVSYYYQLKEGEKCLIMTPDQIASSDKTGNNEVTYTDHHIVSWCRTRTGEEGSYTYSDPWDFERDTISYGDEPLTLYAQWAVDIIYSYNICYKDEVTGETKELNHYHYEVNAGDPFRDTRNFADKRSGYTAERALNEETGAMEVCYFDENGEPWDPDFKHPGGETSTAVNVFVHYIKGEFLYVSTAEEYLKAIRDNKGVWLMNSIDLEGAEVSPFKAANGKFGQAVYGNGFTVSNFKLVCSSGNEDLQDDDELGSGSVYTVSLFGDLDGAIIKDVTFSDVTVDVNTFNSRIKKVRIAPLAVSAANATVEGVTVRGTVVLTKIPSSAQTEIKTEEPFCTADEATTNAMKNVSVNLELDDRR